MANFFRRLFAYFGAAGNAALDEHADPKIQIEQAIEQAQKQHSALAAQAANVIGQARQLEMQITRKSDERDRLEANTRQALTMAQQALAKGDESRAADLEQTASAFATQLEAAEGSLADLEALYQGAQAAAEQAKLAVANNASNLQTKMAERTQLLTKLEAAKMQEKVAATVESLSGLTADSSVPTLDSVRDKIEARYATAMGKTELANGSTAGRMMEVERASIDAGAAARLAKMRADMGIAPAPSAVEPTLGVNTTKNAQTQTS